MTTQTTDPTEEIVRKAAIAAAATVIGGILGTFLLPGIGTALGVKIGAICGGGGCLGS